MLGEINSRIPYERFIVVWNIFFLFIVNNDRSYEIVKKISIMPNELDAYMARAQSDNDSKACGELLCLAICKFTFSSLGACPHIYGNLNDIKYADEVSAVLHNFITLDDFLLKLTDYKHSKLYSNVCENIVANNEKWYAHINIIIPHIQTIVETIKLDDGKFLDFLSKWEIDELADASDIKKTITIEFLQYSRFFDDALSSSCRTKVRQYLDNLPEDDWDEVFEANEADYEIKASRIVKFEWNVHAWNAVRKYLLGLLAADEVPKDTELWLAIIDDIEVTRLLGNFLGTVADMIASKTLSVEMFKFWGNIILTHGVDKLVVTESTLRKFLPVELLNNVECLEIMLENYNVVKRIIEEASEDEIPDFENTLCALAREDEVARELAYKLGIEINDGDNDEEDED